MKKTFLFLAALAMSAMTWASTATFDGNVIKTKNVVNTKGESVSLTVEDVTCTVTRNSGNNPGFYTSSGLIRYYSSDVMTLSVPEGNVITEIAFNMNSGAVGEAAPEGLSGDDKTWTGSAQSVSFTGAATVKINSIVVTYSAGTPVERTLQSIYIDGTATKLEYIEGESFETDGLKVMGKYDDELGDSEITGGIEWTVTPETLELGTTSVTVTATAGGKTSEPKTIDVTVKEKPAAKYVPVAWNEIEDGGKYFITAAKDGEFYFAAKAFATGKATAIAFDASLSPEADMWTFTKSDNVWKISAADGEGLYMTNTNNGLACAADKGADFTIAVGSSAEFTKLTASDGTNERLVALYNQQDFRCYKTSSPSGIYDLKLYGLKKEGVVTKPTFTPAESDFDQEVNVTLTAEEGAEIFYAINEAVTAENAIKYTEPIELIETTTIYAIAKKDGKESAQAEKTYTLLPAYTVEEIAAITPTGQKAVLVLNNDEIVELYAGQSGDISGLYFQASAKKIELYNQNYAFPNTWKVGGKVTGRVMGEWVDFKGTWELKIATEEIDKLDYTAPGDPTGINNVKANAKATKAIVNGQIVIVRDNKTYNVLGF